MFRKIIICLFAAFFIAKAAATNVSSVISASETWKTANSPYFINGNVIIQAGATVTIEPDVRVISTGDFKIVVNGGLRAIGKKDSQVSFESLTIDFGLGAQEYDNTTGAGSRFVYTRFSSFSKSGYNITTKAIDLGFDHCEFNFGYYNVYNNGSSGEFSIWITNSNFTYPNGGFPVYGLYEGSHIYLVGNSFDKEAYIYMGETNVIKNNFIRGVSYTYVFYAQYYTQQADIQCNNVRNANFGCYFPNNNPNFRHVKLLNNNFDSCNTVIFMQCNFTKFDSFEISGNNFLNAKNTVSFGGCNGSGSYTTVNYQNNFWSTTDTTVIKAGIIDFNKNALIPWKVDFSNFLTQKATACWPLNSSSAAGLKDQSEAVVGVELFPNPTENEVNIKAKISANYTVSVFDIRGEKVKEFHFTGEAATLDLSESAPGIYAVRIACEGKLPQVEKLIVK